ncbi:MAG: CotH kinase family protein, partial [Lachnospiraceae bacterium]|nr:CotH kinase family protein [Lachnospiraceae bacterium]
MLKRLKKIIAITVAFALMISLFPKSYVSNVKADSGEEIEADNSEEIVEYDENKYQDVIDEAIKLGVPNAFYKRSFAKEYKENKFPATSGIKYSIVSSDGNKEGLLTKNIDTGVLANTKIDLGEFDFGSLKAGRVVYNMHARKNMKGKAYLYFGDSETAFAEIKLGRTADESVKATKSLTADIRKANLSGKGHIYMTYISNNAVDANNNVMSKSDIKGYLFLESIFFVEASTPVIDFDIDNEVNTIEKINGSEYHSTKGYGNVSIEVPEGYVSEYGGNTTSDVTYELDYIKGRGNSTWQTIKKPYNFKLDKAADLFGMGKSKKWSLLANYYDYTMLRNKLTYDIAAKMGLEYSPKSMIVNLVIAGEYLGCYQLTQKPTISESGVNIDDLEKNVASQEPDISGGYLITMGTSWLTEQFDTSPIINTEAGHFRIDKPEYDEDYPEDAKNAQIEYLEKYFEKINTLVNQTASEDASKNASSDSWRNYMDEQSIIDYYFLQQFSHNGDAYSGSSTFLYKKRNGKLYWGPAWDFDWVAWGAGSTTDTPSPTEPFSMMVNTAPWVGKLFDNDAQFREKFIQRWKVFSDLMNKAIADGGLLDKLKEKTYYSALANYQVRPTTLMEGSQLTDLDNPFAGLYDADGNLYTLNYSNEIERFKGFIRNNLKITNKAVDNIGKDVEYPKVPLMVDGVKYAEIEYNPESRGFDLDDLPKDPTKDGSVFMGWFVNLSEVEEVRLEPGLFLYDVSNDGEYSPLEVYAKFVPESEFINIKRISCNVDTIYVPMYKNGEGGYEKTYEDLASLFNIYPLNANRERLHFYAGPNENELSKLKDSNIVLDKPATIVFVAKAGNVKATLKVVGIDESKTVVPDKYTVAKNVNLELGTYNKPPVTFDATKKKINYMTYGQIKYQTDDDSILSVSQAGEIYAKKTGTANLYIYRYNYDDDSLIIKTTKVNVVKAIPANVTIKSVTKKKANKLNIKLNKALKANGYQVAVYKSEADAKANKSALVTDLIVTLAGIALTTFTL